MAKIHVLSQDTINKIAAGEVIERPMAVVKELVENAIDAKATAVAVEIQEGGKKLIRITDNGSGIANDDISLAFTPHATSKIKSVSDLLAVSSLGFRGEALASIASVSQLEMITKTKEELMGTRFQIDGGEKKSESSVGCPDGTTFLVRNLFYNTPARLKFLKTDQTEAGYISGLIERMSLSHPDISFRFINQKQTKLSTSGNGNLKDVIYHIYGRDITSNLIEINQKEVFCKLKGYIGKPVISRGNRTLMNYFINGRYIKSQVIHRAIEDAYAPYSMQHRYPFTVLHIEIDPKYIDVNVHPQKMEIRFNNEKEIYQSIYHGLSEALKHREFIPEVTFSTQKEKVTLPLMKSEPFEKRRREKQQEQQKKENEFSVNNQINNSSLKGKSAKKQDNEKILKELSKDLEIENQKDNFKDALQNTTGKTDIEGKREKSSQNVVDSEERVIQEKKEEIRTESNDTADQKSFVPDMVHENIKYSVGKTKQETLFDKGILSEKATKEMKIIGQVFLTYWILQYEDKMYLVDQHAAHEKVLYERFMREMKEKKALTQMLQPPIVLTLSMAQQQAVDQNQEIFKNLGYQIDYFGGKEYMVAGVPAHLPQIGTQELLLEVIDSLTEEDGRRKTPEIILEKIASMSCKAAVKGNSSLSVQEVEVLLRELMTLENPYHCPHGRPTMISMSKKEIEKKFKRIV